MLKPVILSFLLCTWLSDALCQNHSNPDSVMSIARADAKNFRLDDATWKKYRRKLPPGSDYFKPAKTSVKNPALLSDSVYVDAYRHEAFKRNKHRRTAWHYALVGGGIAAGAYLILAAAIVIFVGPTM